MQRPVNAGSIVKDDLCSVVATNADQAVTRSWAPHAWTTAALAQLPPGTLLLTQSDDLSAGTVSGDALRVGAVAEVRFVEP